MSALLAELGIDWKLLLAQGVNFLILLVVLTAFVYRPLVRLIEERRKKIELGLRGAEEVEGRLKEVEEIKVRTVAAADRTAAEMIGAAEKEGKRRTQEIVGEAAKKADSVLKEAAVVAEHRKLEELEKLGREANKLIKEAIVKTVELDPSQVDEKLIGRAFHAVKEKLP